MARHILCIADDLTGALEVGAKFADHGWTGRVSYDLTVAGAPEFPVAVYDTETRHVSAEHASSTVCQLAEAAACFHPWLVYKKTDSTLRGNIGAELRALAQVFPDRQLVYAPAYPDMGRTVRDGKLFVEGVPVHLSAFANDPLNPIRRADIAALFGGAAVDVRDSESNQDIQAIARGLIASEKPLLVAGAAAIAGALAERLRRPDAKPLERPRVTSCLVVNGSMHPASAAQVSHAAARGVFDKHWRLFSYGGEGSGRDRALRVGRALLAEIGAGSVDALIVFGGDTAFGIHRALQAPPFEPLGELLPGVPVCRSGPLLWITKAGGFGPPDILSEIRTKLT